MRGLQCKTAVLAQQTTSNLWTLKAGQCIFAEQMMVGEKIESWSEALEVKVALLIVAATQIALTSCALPDYMNSPESLERQFTSLSEGDCRMELGAAPSEPAALAEWQTVYNGCVNEKKSGYYARKASSERAAISDSAKALAAHAALVVGSAAAQSVADIRVTRYNINGYKWTCWTSTYSVTCK